MIKTKEWAESLGIGTADVLPPFENDCEPYGRTAREVAVRTIILHAIVAGGYGINRDSIIDWLKNQDLWSHVSPLEKEFLLSTKPQKLLAEDRKGAQWRQEAQWALLWTIQKVPSLGLPIGICDSIKLVDEIMPGLGDNVAAFIESAEFRPEPELRAEEDRISKLYDSARQASEQDEMPGDLIFGVLFQRYYAFRWLGGRDGWDDVKTGT